MGAALCRQSCRLVTLILDGNALIGDVGLGLLAKGLHKGGRAGRAGRGGWGGGIGGEGGEGGYGEEGGDGKEEQTLHLKRLSLDGCSLTDLSCLCKALSSNKSVQQHACLSPYLPPTSQPRFPSLQPPPLITPSPLLIGRCGLESLSLSHNEPYSTAGDLIQALGEGNQALKTLHLAHCKLGDAHVVPHLCNVLQQGANQHLSWLNLRVRIARNSRCSPH